MGKLNPELEPIRIALAKKKLTDLGITITKETSSSLSFTWKGSNINFFPYTGWHSGKTITDGRGAENLYKQLK